ncbi:tetraacyldisaccharide 4'-kinase [Pseudobdellovibrio exovorus]|uniref:Tetraacyldisaccharide 4'-kinase n=1 Tax=Pseudobdellovibrio exovorus JSS TaxID=1184267 RepID=M4V6Y3_9BACT|nr:tetraacyldisaccharide 4'-kinase [Pseudobdellovibrio exovorus]AGH95137.1 tetraacyldisaccharide 4'-kinase [Pseudobdellovibrio exovorus JSS]
MKVLKPLEKIYHFVTGVKNLLYETNVVQQTKLNSKVLSVGNLSFGGVGKTPCVIYLGEIFQNEMKTVIVCKSYKASIKQAARVDLSVPQAAHIYGDEACLIQSQLQTCEVWSGPIKLETAQASLNSAPQLIIVDDGFSHRQLARDFDLVLVDASKGLAGDYFRESWSNLKRAHAVILTKTNLSDTNKVKDLKNKMETDFPHLSGKIFSSSVQIELSVEIQKPLFVFCALAKPDDFVLQLREMGYNVVQTQFFPDHHMYSAADEKEVLDVYRGLQNQYSDLCLVTTEKDAIKLSPSLKSTVRTPKHFMTMQPEERKVLVEEIRKTF